MTPLARHSHAARKCRYRPQPEWPSMNGIGRSISAGVPTAPVSPQYSRGCANRMAMPLTMSARIPTALIQCVRRIVAERRGVSIGSMGGDRTSELAPAVRFVCVANLGYFFVEFAVALTIGSVALFADSIDFLEDTSVNFLILIALAPAVRFVCVANLGYFFVEFAIALSI